MRTLFNENNEKYLSSKHDMKLKLNTITYESCDKWVMFVYFLNNILSTKLRNYGRHDKKVTLKS